MSIPRKQRRAGDRRPDLVLECEPREPLVERRLAGDEPVDGGQGVAEGEFAVRVAEALPGEPATVRLRPGRLARVEAAMAQEQLGDAEAGAHEVAAQLLACSAETACGLQTGRGHRDRGERPVGSSRASSSASARSLLRRSPLLRGVLPGATTSIRMPSSRAAR